MIDKDGSKYLPVVYNNPTLRCIAKISDDKIYKNFANAFLNGFVADLTEKDFYRFIMKLQNNNKSEYKNGCYLNNQIETLLIEIYNNSHSEKKESNNYELKTIISKELTQYKQFRTLFYFSNMYGKYLETANQNKKNEDIVDIIDKQIEMENKKIREFLPEVNEDNYGVYTAFKDGGMDEVYTLYDLSELDRLGSKLR